MLARMNHDAAVKQCLCDALPSADPTGTSDVRTRYKTLLDQRWRKVVTEVRAAIISQDMLALSNKQSALSMSMQSLTPETRIKAFQTWLDNLLLRVVVQNDAAYLDPMIGTAFNRGLKRAMRLTKSTKYPPDVRDTIAALQQVTLAELQGIVEAVSQRLVRRVGHAALDGTTPANLVKVMQLDVQQVGMVRSRALVEAMVAKSHSTATLDQFAAAGKKRVGVIPETIKRNRKKIGDAFGFTGPGANSFAEVPSASTIGRIRRANAVIEELFGTGPGEVDIETAGDEDVCPECEDLEMDGPYSINEARSLIPAHPWCRCAFMPADDDDDTTDALRDEWNEEDHPRAANGEFGEGGAGGAPKDDPRIKDPKADHADFRTVTKGTDPVQNERIVARNGVKVTIGDGVSKEDAHEALAHIIADSNEGGKLLSNSHIQFKDMGPSRRGNQSGNLITIDSKSAKEGGPGFASGIIKHELEHKKLTLDKVPSSKQESRVQNTAGTWAAYRFASMAKTNPRAAAGFAKAAREQGVKV